MVNLIASDVTKFMNLDEEQLFYQLGLEFSTDKQTSRSHSYKQDNPERRGRRWFSKNLDELRKAICEDWNACQKLEKIEDSQDKLVLVIAIFEIVSTLITGIPAALVTAILLKMGISNLCECEKDL